MGDIPSTGLDVFTDEALRDPYPIYRRLRDLGPVVHLEANGMYAFPRYRQVRPEQLRELTPQVRAEAERVVETLVGRGTFDAATELAEHLPLTIVSDLVGLGDSGPAHQGLFLATGRDGGLREHRSGSIRAGGPRSCTTPPPSLDTTIYAISSAIRLFARNPEQWEILRADHSLIPHAINEALRLESPVQRFTRLVTEDHDVEGHVLPAGSRVVFRYGSANRDERKYPDPTGSTSAASLRTTWLSAGVSTCASG